MKPRKYNCKGWNLLTDAEKDPDSNCITKQEYEETLAAAKAQKVCEWHSRSPSALGPWLLQAHICHCPAEEAGGGAPGQAKCSGVSSCVRATPSLEGH